MANILYVNSSYVAIPNLIQVFHQSVYYSFTSMKMLVGNKTSTWC